MSDFDVAGLADGIEEAALASVWAADEGDLRAVADDFPPSRVAEMKANIHS